MPVYFIRQTTRYQSGNGATISRSAYRGLRGREHEQVPDLDNTFKIGFSRVPAVLDGKKSKGGARRLRECQTGNPYLLELAADFADLTLDDEKQIHHLFREYRLQGEWFQHSDIGKICDSADVLTTRQKFWDFAYSLVLDRWLPTPVAAEVLGCSEQFLLSNLHLLRNAGAVSGLGISRDVLSKVSLEPNPNYVANVNGVIIRPRPPYTGRLQSRPNEYVKSNQRYHYKIQIQSSRDAA